MLGFPWMHTPIPQISWAKKEITHWFKHCLTHCLQVLKLLAASPSVESPEPCSTVEIPSEYEHLANGIGEGFVFVFFKHKIHLGLQFNCNSFHTSPQERVEETPVEYSR